MCERSKISYLTAPMNYNVIKQPSGLVISLLENGTDGIILLDQSKSVRYVSPVVVALLKPNVPGSGTVDLAAIVEQEDLNRFTSLVGDSLLADQSVTSTDEFRLKTANAELLWVEASFSNLLQENAVELLVITLRNITDSKLVENKLVHANRLYAFTSQINQSIVRIQDEQMLFEEACRIAVEYGKFKMAWIGLLDAENKKATLIASAGTTADELTLFENYSYDPAGPINSVVGGADYSVVQDIKHENSAAWERIATKQKYNSAMVLGIKKFGELIAVLNIYSPEVGFFNNNEVMLLREANSDICFALEILEDKRNRRIAEQKRLQAEDELLDSIKRYELVSRATSDAIWDWDLIRDTLYVAEGFETLFGYPSREVPASDNLWSDNIHPDEQILVMDSLDQVVHSQELIWRSQYRFRRANGNYATVTDTAYVIRDKQGRAIRMVGAMRDITASIEDERRLAEMNHNLQAYTNELVNTNTGLQQFSYIISHNLRSPVANIVALTEHLQDESNTPEASLELHEALKKSVGLLNGVIEDLNAILAVKNKISDQKEEISLVNLLSDIQLSIQSLIDDSGLSVNVSVQGDDTIYSLKSYLHSIFINLLSNSIKYARPGIAPKIEINIASKGSSFEIRFKDNGLGIDLEKKRSQVFGLYKRFHENIRGKGMGLFMVKTQVETLGGKISIESEVNGGTEFIIQLPIDG